MVWLNDLLLLNVELIQLLESLDLSQQVLFWHLCSCLRCYLLAVFTHVHGRCWCAGLFVSLGSISSRTCRGTQRGHSCLGSLVIVLISAISYSFHVLMSSKGNGCTVTGELLCVLWDQCALTNLVFGAGRFLFYCL